MRISDWTSDVCSSDLAGHAPVDDEGAPGDARRILDEGADIGVADVERILGVRGARGHQRGGEHQGQFETHATLSSGKENGDGNDARAALDHERETRAGRTMARERGRVACRTDREPQYAADEPQKRRGGEE